MRHTIIAITFLVALAFCSAQPQTLTDVINSTPSFSTLAKLLQSTGLSYTLSRPNLYTVFAPNNTAFNSLPSETLKYLLDPNNSGVLRSVLLYHVVPGLLGYNQLGGEYTTAQGSNVTLTPRNPIYYLYPSVIQINNARITNFRTGGIAASNGVVYALDRVLLTDSWAFTGSYPNLYGLVSTNPNLSTLKYALDATGLDQALLNLDAQLTLFAPTNEAFEDPVLTPLFDPSNIATLKNVLLYHVLGAPVFSTDLFDGQQAKTLNPVSPLITVTRTVFPGASSTAINDATVLTADATAGNGVMHTINRVLLPLRPF